MGYDALSANKTGIHSIAMGHTPMRKNESGSYNIGIGPDSL